MTQYCAPRVVICGRLDTLLDQPQVAAITVASHILRCWQIGNALSDAPARIELSSAEPITSEALAAGVFSSFRDRDKERLIRTYAIILEGVRTWTPHCDNQIVDQSVYRFHRLLFNDLIARHSMRSWKQHGWRRTLRRGLLVGGILGLVVAAVLTRYFIVKPPVVWRMQAYDRLVPDGPVGTASETARIAYRVETVDANSTDQRSSSTLFSALV